MQRDARAADLFYQCFATRLNFVQVRRTKWLLSRSLKNNITHLQIADRPIVSCCKRVEFFCDAQRRLANLVVRTNISDDSWINGIAKNNERVIAHFDRVRATGKRPRNHDKWIGRADEETEFF
jgi:hypothetical protein